MRAGVALALGALANARVADLLAFADAAPGALVVEPTAVGAPLTAVADPLTQTALQLAGVRFTAASVSGLAGPLGSGSSVG